MAEATEAAQRLADEHNIDLSGIQQGSGSTGNITVEDVRARIEEGSVESEDSPKTEAEETVESAEGVDGDAMVEGTDENPVVAEDVTDTAPPKEVYLRQGLTFRQFELEDGRVLDRDTPLLVHPDEWKSSISKLTVGGVKIAETR